MAANTAVFAATVLLLFVTLQFGLWFYAREVAAAAAQHAVDASRVETGTAEAGEATARDYLDQVRGLDSPGVSVSRDAERVTATVTGRAVSLVAFLDPAITVTVSAPVERVVE